jgi:hypothetical protein
LLHAVAPASENLPGAHMPAHVGCVIAATLPKVPARHGLHVDEPGREKDPGGHALAGGAATVEPAPHAKPASHGPVQLLLPTAVVAPKRPGGHAVHSDAPPSEKVPAAHAVPDGDVDDAALHAKPGAAVQGEHVAAAAAENDPGLHATAVPLRDPGVGHAKPALQSLHEVAPATLKVPAGHSAADGVADVEPAGHA